MPEVYAAFAELRLVERAHDDARALIQEALDAVGDALDALYVPALFSMGARVEADAAEAARDGRRPDAAVEAHARAADHLRRLETLLGPHDDERRPPTARAHLATCRAEVARAAGASDGSSRAPAHAAWTAAVAAWDAVAFPYPAAYARRRQAEAALAAGQQRDGARALREAYAAAKGLGAEVLVRDVELLARRSRIALDEEPQRRRRTRDPERAAHELTLRELDVLALVAEGRTDREIAARLFITHKTASHHVSHILTKLSVRTRNEAAAWAYRQGLMDSGAPGSSAAR
jgi:DNA-binding CsgD family transcriptional regulator